MKLMTMKNSIKTVAGTAWKWTKAHGPTIGMVAGTASTAAGTVILCKNAPKLEVVLKEQEAKLAAGTALTKAEHRKELNRIRFNCIKELAKIFGIGTILWCLGMGAMWTSNVVLRKRQLAAMAALGAVTANFEAYRQRVREKYGVEADYKLRTGEDIQKVELEVEANNGKKKTVKAEIPVKESVTTDAYSRIFDSSNPYWFEEDIDQNLVFLKQRQSWLNDKLSAKFTQTLLLNDALEDTGFKGTKVGAHAGWTLRKQDGKRDGFIDFGIFDPKTGNPYPHVLKTLHDSRYIVLDFNAEGYVLEDGYDD